MNPFLVDPLWQGDIQAFLETENINDHIDTSIQNFRVISSYNWADRNSRILEVPGGGPSEI